MNRGRPHLRFQALATCALAVGLLPVAMAASVNSPEQLVGALFGWAVAMYFFATGGTLVAALTYEPGETMRPGWLLLSASYLVLVPALLRMGPDPSGLLTAVRRAPWVASGSSILFGALAVAGFVVLSRGWRALGLDTTSRAGRYVTRLLALGAGALLAGPDLLQQLPAAIRGDVLAAGDVITDLLDVSRLRGGGPGPAGRPGAGRRAGGLALGPAHRQPGLLARLRRGEPHTAPPRASTR